MIKNYLKLAWRVLFRNKFFTAISLFGISFTLMVLMLVTSAFQTEMGAKAPLGNQEDLVLLTSITLSKQYYDTIPVIDTSYLEGIAIFDTVKVDIVEAGESIGINGMSRSIVNDYMSDLSSARTKTVYTTNRKFDIYKNNTKISITPNHCDYQFWEIFNFKFTEGAGFTQYDFEQEVQKIVLTKGLAEKYYGESKGILNREFSMDGKKYIVCGVVEDPFMNFDPVRADVFIPSSILPLSELDETFYQGSFEAIFLASDGTKALKKEIKNLPSIIPNDRHESYNEMKFYPGTFKEMYAKGINWEDEPEEAYRYLKYVFFGLMSLFILLPTLNLINLNVSRILDRSSEIGVRKAFGAHKSNIINQFVFENIVLTLIGGIIGFVLSLVVMNLINNTGFLGPSRLELNFKFAIFSILLTILFGILSGLLPAYKMAKTQIVSALKQNQL